MKNGLRLTKPCGTGQIQMLAAMRRMNRFAAITEYRGVEKYHIRPIAH